MYNITLPKSVMLYIFLPLKICQRGSLKYHMETVKIPPNVDMHYESFTIHVWTGITVVPEGSDWL